MSFLNDFWDDGRSPYEPNNPWMNAGMIIVAGLAPFALAGLFGLVYLLVSFIGWLI